MMFLIAAAAGGAAEADSVANSIDAYEAVIELTWRVTVTDWLALQPDLQYSVNPSADRALRNAVAVGLRFELVASALRW